MSIKYSVFLGIALLLIAAIALVAQKRTGVISAAHANDTHAGLTIEQAKQRIEKQQALEDIPKAVWKELLTPDVYHILWEKGTERAFTGSLLTNKQEGVYVTAGCNIPVFRSDHKFKSGTGWPSFWDVYDSGNIILKEDRSWGMRRTEILSKCGEHLGHVFNDGPAPTGLRYCINSLALKFVPKIPGEPASSPVK